MDHTGRAARDIVQEWEADRIQRLLNDEEVDITNLNNIINSLLATSPTFLNKIHRIRTTKTILLYINLV
jgi:hypothetical protein